MKKFLSILLLAVFGVWFAVPLLAQDAAEGASVALCCRKNGRHQCMAGMGERGQPSEGRTTFGAVPEKCPYCPATSATTPNVLDAPPAQAIFAALVSHTVGVEQTESKLRIAEERSRQKRGPPVDSL